MVLACDSDRRSQTHAARWDMGPPPVPMRGCWPAAASLGSQDNRNNNIGQERCQTPDRLIIQRHRTRFQKNCCPMRSCGCAADRFRAEKIDMAAYVLTDWPMRPLCARLQRTNRRGRSLSDSRPLFERRVSAKVLGSCLNKY
jgi:hypothetical protein